MYQSDLKDEQWALIEHYFKRPDPRGAVNRHSKRAIVNGIFYVIRSGAQWRMLPKDLPPWQTVYDHYRRLRQRGIWDKILSDLNKKYRLKIGRQANPSYVLMDAQSVKTQYHGNERGFDGGKKN